MPQSHSSQVNRCRTPEDPRKLEDEPADNKRPLMFLATWGAAIPIHECDSLTSESRVVVRTDGKDTRQADRESRTACS